MKCRISQRSYAKDWLLYSENMGQHLSLDETAFSNGDLYTILTNAKGKKGALITIIKGTKADSVIKILHEMPLKIRKQVKEVTLDMAGNMGLIVKKSFSNTVQVIDRFHVQKLTLDALQEIRIKHRWNALDQENDGIEKAYKLCQNLSWIFNNTKDKTSALIRLAKWDEKVRQAQFKSFNTIARTMAIHYKNILNYFDNRSTNASAESFNAKIKAFRTQFRGVRNVDFFLYRLITIFA